MLQFDSGNYNPWPSGALPDSWQRPELALLREKGYAIEDPRDAVGLFEEAVARYSGSRYAVAVDSCSSGLFLSMKYRKAAGSVSLPKRTYVSVPMQVVHAGCTPEARDERWQGLYELEPLNVIDSAARFTEGMYVGNDSLQVLSFQIKKRLPIGRGGMILTDDLDAYRWLKLASYDGRDLNTRYDSMSHVHGLGWHMYMTPEDAARGLLLLESVPPQSPDVMDWRHYPDWTQWPVLRTLT